MDSNNLSKEMYEEAIEYVRKTLTEAGRDSGRRHPFRSRTAHTLRVLKWAERLIEGRNDVNSSVLFMAAIFHDVGYVADELDNHQKVSEKIFREYADSKDFSDEFIEKTAHCISIHSEKERMRQPENMTIEEILLMEADLLDEEGALSICWDGLACGWEKKFSYQESYERTLLEGTPKLNIQPMITEKAKKYWEEKQEFMRLYIMQLSRDLEQWEV